MAFVGKIAIIVFQGLFFAGFVVGSIQVEGEKAAVWYLSDEVADVLV